MERRDEEEGRRKRVEKTGGEDGWRGRAGEGGREGTGRKKQPVGRGTDVCGGSDRGRQTAAGSRSSVVSGAGRFIVTDMIAAAMLRAPATYHAGA